MAYRNNSVQSSKGLAFESANVVSDIPAKTEYDVPYNDATTFTTEGREAYYRPSANWEGIHRYDPNFSWEPEEEKKLIRKIDWRICAFACFLFFSLQLDRGNISQANSDDMLHNLGITTDQYDYGLTIFYCSFLVAELPSQMISKRVGPDRWIPIQMVCWSLVASCQAFMKGATGFYICRFLLGVFEGGFIPDTILYLSYFYTSVELPRRLSYFWVAYQSTSIISAFLAYGILHLAGTHGLYGWQWLFAIEGILTGCIGIFAWFYLPASPYSTASWFRGKNGWFTEREEKIIANRVIRDDPSKGDMHNRQALTWGMLWECLSDWHMWPIYFIGLTWSIPEVPQASYLTLELKDLGFGTFETNLLVIPAYVLFILQLLFWTWLSERINQRIILGVICQFWMLIPLIVLEVLPAHASHWARWACCSLIVGFPYIHAILVAICSRNAGSVRTRTVASALYNMAVQGSTVIGTEIYRTNDAPLYRTGNKALIAICVFNALLFIAAKWFYVSVNSSRDKIWNTMTSAEKDEYLSTTTDQGNKRLDFRFAS